MTQAVVLATSPQTEAHVSYLIIALMGLGGLVWLVLFLAALVGIVKAPHRSMLERIGWLALVFFLPLLGPILWFLIGRRTVIQPRA